MTPPTPAPTEAIAAMLRNGATYRQILTELPTSTATIAAVRRTLNIPLPPSRRSTPRHPAPPREDIAHLLRQGATYTEIRTKLDVSSRIIARTRQAYNIPLPPTRAKRTPAELAAIEDQALAMLRDGATCRTIHTTLRLSPNRIADLRKEHDIPVPHRDVWATQRWSIDEAFTHYAIPTTTGNHLIWTGPRSGRSLDLIASGRKHNARHIAFQKHHHRPPQGRVWRTCNQTDCIAGAHHTDHTIRQTHQRADQAYTHIFTTGPTP